MASVGFLPVNLVTSPFRAAITLGSRATHCLPLTRREAHLLGILVHKQPLCEGPVPALYNPLVPVDVNPTAPNMNRVLSSSWPTHELAPRVNLKELRPLQRPPSVDPRRSIGDLCRGLASQRLSLFVALGYIYDRESVAEGFPLNAVVWLKEQIRLVDLVGHCTATSNFGRGMHRGAGRSARWPAF